MNGSKASLEKEDHRRDADFNKALHGSSAQAGGGISAMFAKNRDAKKLAVDEYFKHFDQKTAADETAADREVSCFAVVSCLAFQSLSLIPETG